MQGFWFRTSLSGDPRKKHLRPERYRFDSTKAQFRRWTFHEPNLIRIKADPNYLHMDQLNWFRRQSQLKLNCTLVQKAKNAHFGWTAYKIRYNILCIRFGTWKVRRLNQSHSKVTPDFVVYASNVSLQSGKLYFTAIFAKIITVLFCLISSLTSCATALMITIGDLQFDWFKM